MKPSDFQVVLCLMFLVTDSNLEELGTLCYTRDRQFAFRIGIKHNTAGIFIPQHSLLSVMIDTDSLLQISPHTTLYLSGICFFRTH